MRYVVGVDIGGTFTDFSVIDGRGRTTLWKEASTPREPADAVRQGLQSLAHAQGLELHDFLSQIDLFVHGSTIATNTVIQRNGPKTALLCTEGFRDVIYFRDGYKPERFNLSLAPPVDFIPRHLRLPVGERIDYKGDILIPLDDASVVEAARTFAREQVKAIAVAFLWSVINPAHERRARAVLERELPGVPVVLSSDVLPAIREWERTCATMLSAYILPGISHYMQDLEEFLRANGFQRRVLFIQLNGGCSSGYCENLPARPSPKSPRMTTYQAESHMTITNRRCEHLCCDGSVQCADPAVAYIENDFGSLNWYCAKHIALQ